MLFESQFLSQIQFQKISEVAEMLDFVCIGRQEEFCN